MGKRGAPPTPKAILQARGSWRGAIAADDVNMPEGEPDCPDTLNDGAYAYWVNIVPLVKQMRVLTPADGHSLGMLCTMLDERDTCELFLKKNGNSYVDDKSVRRMNPEVRLLSDLRSKIQRAFLQFGLTPSARSGLKIAPVEKKKDDGKDRFFTSGN